MQCYFTFNYSFFYTGTTETLQTPFSLFLFFTKRLTLAIYKQRAHILALEYTDQYMKIRYVFPVNNILL